MSSEKSGIQEERIMDRKNGFAMLFLWIVVMLAGIAAVVGAAVLDVSPGLLGAAVVLGIILFIISIVGMCGLKVLNPNEAYVRLYLVNITVRLRVRDFTG